MADPESPPTASGADDAVRVGTVSIDTLDEAHRIPVVKAISNILSTQLAESTYAQIVDGLPLAAVYDEVYVDPLMREGQPAYQHDTLCPGVLEETRNFHTGFDPSILKFEATVLLKYMAASPGSRSFKMLLIEIAAMSVHQIAVLLFKLDRSRHKEDGIASWTPPKEDNVPGSWWYFNPDGPPPTLFSHRWYTDYKQYPDGAADMAGFWAENRILGGVILFDRQTPESDAVYIHPDWNAVTYRICKLHDTQKQQLLEFLQSDSPESSTSLPIRPDDTNRNRIDPEEPITLTGVYRHIWERNPPPEYMGDERSGDVIDTLNFTSHEDQFEAKARWMSRYERYR